MPNQVTCPNGHPLLIGDLEAGQQLVCPHCAASVTIPDANSYASATGLAPDPIGVDFPDLTAEDLPEITLPTADLGAAASPTWDPSTLQTDTAESAAPVADERTPFPWSDYLTAPMVAFLGALVLGAGVLMILLVAMVFSSGSPNDGVAVAGNELSGEPEVRRVPRRSRRQRQPAPAANQPAPAANAQATVQQRVVVQNGGASPRQEPPHADSPITAPKLVLPTAQNSRRRNDQGHSLRKTGAAKGLETCMLAEPSWGCAYDPTGGTLAVLSDKAGVLLFDVVDLDTGNLDPRIIPLPHPGSDICLKNANGKALFLVSSHQSPLIQVIDASAGKIVTEVEVLGPPGIVRLVTSSRPNDPYLFFLGHRDRRRTHAWANRLGRIQLSTKEIVGPSLQTWDNVTAGHDGQLLASRKDNLFALRLNAAQTHWTSFPIGEKSPQQKHALPADLGETYGWATDFQSQLGDFEPRIAFNKLPIAVGWGLSGVQLRSMSDYQLIGQLVLDPRWKRASPAQNASGRITELYPRYSTCTKFIADETRQQFLLLVHDQLLLAKLADINLRNPPSEQDSRLIVRHPTPMVLTTGQEVRFPLQAASEGASIELIDVIREPSHDDMRNLKAPVARERQLGIENGHFYWTPDIHDMGRCKVSFRVTDGDQTRTWDWRPQVGLPSLPVPFWATGIRADYEDTSAIVWGADSSEVPPAKASRYFVAAVDLTTSQVTQQMEVDQPVQHAVQVGDDVIVCHRRAGSTSLHGTTTITRYQMETEQKQASVQANFCRSMDVLGDKYLITVAPHNSSSCFEADTLLELKNQVRSSSVWQLQASSWGSHLVWNGIMWDRDMRTPMLFVAPTFVSNARTPYSIHNALNGRISLAQSGPDLWIWHTDGTSAPSTPSYPQRRCLQYHPALVEYRRGELICTNWVNTSLPPTERETRLRIKPANPRSILEPWDISDTATSLYFVNEGRVHHLPIRDFVPEELPFRFIPKQSDFVLDGNKTVRLKYHAPGANRYWLQVYLDHGSTPTWQEESKTGSFQVKLNDFRRLRSLLTSLARTSSSRPDPLQIQSYIDQIEPTLKQLERRLPRGIPVPVRVVVMAQHADGIQRAALQHYYFVTLPQQFLMPAR